MRKSVVQFLAVLLTALVTGLTFAHTLEAPMKLGVDGPTWLMFQHTLYRYFAVVGGPVELGAVASTLVLAYLARHDPYRRVLNGAAAALVSASFFVVWVLVVRPVNAQTATWTTATIPEDWMRWRLQWELGHVGAFVLQAIALILLLVAAMHNRRPDISNPGAREILD